ncbi:MAG TPA: ribonuclease P protein component 3 [Methanocella sp.]|nr:ribonuclease P protein component 3 [Methanocella sp.]
MNELHFYDLNIHPYPEGSSSVSRMALAAMQLGLHGVCVLPHHEFFAGKEQWRSDGCGVINGVEIVASNQNDMRRLIDKYRKKVAILAIHGGDEAVNRAACEDGRVDILMHPQEGGKTGGINHIIARLAADRNVAFEFSLYPLIHSRGGYRVKTIAAYRANFALARKYGAPYVITSGAVSHYDLRDARSIVSIARLFGLNEAEAVKGISHYPEQIIHRSSPTYIMEGVELVETGSEERSH